MSKTRRILLTLLALALLTRPVDVLLAAMLPDAAVDPVPQCIGGMLAALLLLGLPAWLHRPWESPRLPRAKSALPGMLLAGAAAVLIRTGLDPLDAAWQSALGLASAPMPIPTGILQAMLYIAALAVIPALTEEAFFRGALLTGLLDGSRRITAVLLTTMSFALMHGSIANLPSLLMLSLMLTLLMLRTGHIAVPIAAHLVYNLTALSWIAAPAWVNILCGAGLIVLSVQLITGQPRVAHPPMKLPDALIAALTLAVLILAALL